MKKSKEETETPRKKANLEKILDWNRTACVCRLKESAYLYNRRWRITDLHKRIISRALPILFVLLVFGCAQHPSKDIDFFSEDFGSGVVLNCRLSNNVLFICMSSKIGESLSIVVDQKASTENAKVTKQTTVYRGTKRTIEKAFRIKKITDNDFISVSVVGEEGIIIKQIL